MKEKNRILNHQADKAGDIEKEIGAIRQIQKENAHGYLTFSVGCTEYLTLICC